MLLSDSHPSPDKDINTLKAAAEILFRNGFSTAAKIALTLSENMKEEKEAKMDKVMDINETLNELREAFFNADIVEAAKLFAELDSRLYSGGILPEDWKRSLSA